MLRRSLSTLVLTTAAVFIVLIFGAVSSLAGTGPAYSVGTPVLDQVSGTAASPAPWTLSQGDPSASPYNSSLPTFTFGGAPSVTFGGLTTPNLSVYPGSGTDVAGSATNPAPYLTGFAGTPGPLAGYCANGGPNPELGAVAREPVGAVLPMSPYYFPFVMHNPNDPNVLTGFFDYRPKDSEEAIVVANSFDGGNTWHYVDEKLELNTNVCPDGIQNDNGQGHPYVAEVDGTYYLYTLNRVTGDSLGQGLLVHKLSWTTSATYPWGDPIGELPVQEPVDGGPNPANAQTGGAAPGYDSQVTQEGATKATATITVPNYQETPAGVTLKVESTANFSNLKGGPGGQLIDVGSATAYSGLHDSTTPIIHCTEETEPTVFKACVAVDAAGQTGSQSVTVNAGDELVAPPEVPDTAEVTDPATEGTTTGEGLQAPDGIIGTVPASSLPEQLPNGTPRSSIPAGATVVIYGEKLLNYYMPASLTGKVTIPTLASGKTVAIPVSGFGYTGTGAQTSASLTNDTQPTTTPTPLSPAVTISLGYNSTSASSEEGIAAVTCTGADTDFGGTGKGDELTGCTASSSGLPSAATSVSVKSGNEIGGPGACAVPSATLGLTGEGSTKPKTLFKNNEDYTVVRAAYTTDGLTFHDLGIVSGLNDPSYTGNAGDTTPVGQVGTDELRWVASRGTIVQTAQGETMFMSGADCQDGDSDAFQQMFYSNSTNGIEWSQPVPLLTTDPTFSASAEQDAAQSIGIDIPLGISAYYSGRAYDPNVIENANGSLSMIFSGYRTAKPLPTTGSEAKATGGNPLFRYTPQATEPALYRNILTVPLTVKEAGPQGPEGKEGKEGKTGPTGPEGKEGPEGKTGSAGPEGKTGPEGPTGKEGPEGKEGKAGPEGKTGLQGPIGPTGLTGPIGLQGPQGPAGPKGPTGPAGPQGPAGPAGPVGQITCAVTLKGLTIVVTCQVTPPATTVARAADRASKVAVRVMRGGKILASGSGALRKDVVSAKLRTKHGLGRGSYVVTVSLPGGARSVKASVK
jgi:hypothetical protein